MLPLPVQPLHQLHRVRRRQPQLMEPLHLCKNLSGRAVHGGLAVVHHNDTVRLLGLRHVVGDEHHRHAPLPVQPMDGVQHLPPSVGVQHSRGLVQHDALRLHGNDAGNGHPLLLSAGEQVRRMAGKITHTHRLQRIVHPLTNFLRRNAQIFRGKGHILLHHVGDDLVIRVLEHHAHPPPDLQQHRLVMGIHPLYIHRPARWQQHGVHVLSQSRFPGAVMPQHHHEAALLDAEAHAPQRRLAPLALLRRIGEGQVLCFDHGHILRSLFNRSQMVWLTFSICHSQTDATATPSTTDQPTGCPSRRSCTTA